MTDVVPASDLIHHEETLHRDPVILEEVQNVVAPLDRVKMCNATLGTFAAGGTLQSSSKCPRSFRPSINMGEILRVNPNNKCVDSL